MFTDLADYSGAAQRDERRALALLRDQEELVRPIFAQHRGREVKSTGDGFLVEFDSALHAVECGQAIARAVSDRNDQRTEAPLRVRIGIHLGDVEERDGDIFGDAVNIASRVESAGEPGYVYISGPVYEQVRNKVPFGFEHLPPAQLKHIEQPIELYRTRPSEAPRASDRSARDRHRIAVLPLTNISPDAKDEYIADGLTEELIGSLSRLRELRVVARTSVAQYKATPKSVEQIGRELGVGSVLEGSVRKAGSRLRIRLQLVDSGSQEPLWAGTFDRDLTDVFALETEIADRTADALRLQMLGGPREGRARTAPSPEAFESYLKGVHASREYGSWHNAEEFGKSIQFFEAAIAQDPEFALPYATLGNAYIAASGLALEASAAFAKARPLIARALELDPESADAHAALGNLALQAEHNWAEAEREFRRAISLNPSLSSARFWFANLLMTQQRFEEAEVETRTVAELDPFWEHGQAMRIQLAYFRDDFETAITLAQKAVDRARASALVYVNLGLLYASAGQLEEARREAARAEALATPQDRALLALLLALLGEPTEARAEAERLSRATGWVNLSHLAALWATVGEFDRALGCLEQDVGSKTPSLPFSYLTMALVPLRTDPRFLKLLNQLGLPTTFRNRPRLDWDGSRWVPVLLGEPDTPESGPASSGS